MSEDNIILKFATDYVVRHIDDVVREINDTGGLSSLLNSMILSYSEFQPEEKDITSGIKEEFDKLNDGNTTFQPIHEKTYDHSIKEKKSGATEYSGCWPAVVTSELAESGTVHIEAILNQKSILKKQQCHSNSELELIIKDSKLSIERLNHSIILIKPMRISSSSKSEIIDGLKKSISELETKINNCTLKISYSVTIDDLIISYASVHQINPNQVITTL